MGNQSKRESRRSRKHQSKIDPFDVNMPELFGDLVRERSLLGVLDALAEACRARAEHYRSDIEKEPDMHPTLKVDWEDEVEFFDSAAEQITLAAEFLKSDWQQREMPMAADGQFRGFTSKRSREAGQQLLETLIGTINDPAATAEERYNAAARLSQEAGGMIWYEQATGKPNFELAKAFKEATAELVDPNKPEAEKRKIAAELQSFIFGNDAEA